MEKKTNKCIFW